MTPAEALERRSRMLRAPPAPSFSFRCGGFAATTKRKTEFRGGRRPPQPPLREYSTGALGRATSTSWEVWRATPATLRSRGAAGPACANVDAARAPRANMGDKEGNRTFFHNVDNPIGFP